MKDLHAEFMNFLVSKGWLLIAKDDSGDSEGVAIADKTTGAPIPNSYLEFLKRFKSLSNADESRWFISTEGFSGNSDSAFSWNEFEKMSLDAAMTDRDAEDVRTFWGRHLPILMAVDGDYQYIALDRMSGAVVHGVEPDFESVSNLADSFDGFMVAVMEGKRGEVLFD
ncbi:SMI1/KNR4 family protein [Stenotrophomonas rhizophila]